MELKRLVVLLWRWSWFIALFTLLAGMAAYVVSQQITPIYEASTTLLVRQASANGSSDLNALRASESLATSYAALLVKRPVLNSVIANLKLKTDSVELAKRVKVDPVQNTQLIVLTIQDSNPQHAADIANEITQVFIQQNREVQASPFEASKESLLQQLDQIQTQIDGVQNNINALGIPGSPEQLAEQSQLQALLAQYQSSYSTVFKSLADVRLAEAQSSDNIFIVEPAIATETPVQPMIRLNILLASIIGAMLAAGLVLVLGYLDDSVNSTDQVKDLIGATTLAAVVNIKSNKVPNKLITIQMPSLPAVEAYRLLRTRITFASIDKSIRTIVITSSAPSDGKTVTAANLAVAMAQSGKRVILVDADLRQPMLHKFFNQDNIRGVSTALAPDDDVQIDEHLVLTGVENLRLMPSGPAVSDTAELLGSQAMNRLIQKLSKQADIVMFDSSPLLAVVDATLIAHACDAALLVVRAGSTRADELRRANDLLLQSGTRLLGVVLNRVSSAQASYARYRDHTSSKQFQERATTRLSPDRTKNHSGNGHGGGEPSNADKVTGDHANSRD